MQVKSIAECSAILSTFIKLQFVIKTFVYCLFLSGRVRQVLLYSNMQLSLPNVPYETKHENMK